MPETTELTGEQLAAAVATSVMGWKSTTLGHFASTEPLPAWETDDNDGFIILCGDYYSKLYAKDFRPDLNIAQAWEVKDQMLSLGYDFDYEEEPSHGERPIAGFIKGGDSWYVQHESAATAICRAAIAAVESACA